MEVKQLDSHSLLLRQALYRFCAAGLLYPEQERVGNLKQGAEWLKENINEAWPESELNDRVLAACHWVEKVNGDLTSVQGQWVNLFGVSRDSYCYPYEGFIVDPEQAGTLQAMLQHEYATAGLELSSDDTPDHISTELEYMSFLCGIEIEAVERGDSRLLQQVLVRQRKFLTEHLARWLPSLTQRVSTADGGAFLLFCSIADQLASQELLRLEQATPAGDA